MNLQHLTIDKVQEILLAEKYVCDRALATVVYLSLSMGKPLLLEGEAGVGKTEIAKVLAKVLDAKLIRLQCYEGLDASTSLYEWNYPKQMLRIKLEEVEHGDKEKLETEIFTEEYLIKRPLLEAIQTDGANPPVLLIDEIDRLGGVDYLTQTHLHAELLERPAEGHQIGQGSFAARRGDTGNRGGDAFGSDFHRQISS